MGTARVEDFQILIAEESMDVLFEMCAWPDTVFGERIEARVEVVE